MASDAGVRDAKDLIEQAEAKTNIFELPCLEMKAAVRIDNKGRPLDGSYVLLWNGPDQWREEITFPGYSEVQVGSKGVVFLKRTTDFLPWRIGQLRWTLGYGPRTSNLQSFVHLAPGPHEAVKKVLSLKLQGRKVECVEIADKEGNSRQVRVDPSTGILVRQDPFVDRDVTSVGTRLFPRFLSYVERGKSVVEINVRELKAIDQMASSVFEPPQGATVKPGCMNPSPARRIKRVTPRYPEEERRSRIQGTVAMQAVIGKDGNPRGLRLVSGVTPGLNDISLEAARQWRYEPATCNGIAVDVETLLTVQYELRW